MHQKLNWKDFQDKNQLESILLQDILNIAKNAISENGSFKIVMAGGSTPEKLYKSFLDVHNQNFSDWELYVGDERCLPVDSEDRNSHMIKRSFIDHLPDDLKPKFFPINTEKGSQEASSEYNSIIDNIDQFDLVLLGLGEDGHTASLFPGHQWDNQLNAVAVSNAPKPPSDRVSMTPKAFLKADKIFFIVTGHGKKDAVNAWKEGEGIPASKIMSENLIDVYCNLD
jgi:6-phosphogluconolactonase